MVELDPAFDLSGQAAIVTGAARGIGFATAKRLASAGASVLIVDLDGDAAADAAKSLGSGVAFKAGDITQPDEPLAAVDAALEAFGRLDIVVNNAGYDWDVKLVEMSDEQWEAMIAIHATAPFRLLRAAGPHLIARPRSEDGATDTRQRKVVNMSSVAGTMGEPWQVNYSAGKAAVIGLTKALAREWAEHAINVNAVAPGIVDTRLTRLDEGQEGIEIGGRRLPLGLDEERRASLNDNVALGRQGTVEEVANLVYFLCCPASNYIHGQVVSVNGGLAMGMSS